MPEETKSEIKQEKENIAVVKSTRKSTIFSRITDKLPRINKKLFILLLIILVIPLTIALSLAQQELRSRASGVEDRKVFLGMTTGANPGYKISNCNAETNCLERDLEKIKSETGAYPAVYPVFANMDMDKANTLAIFKYLDSKGIAPALYLMPVGHRMERRDGRFLMASPSGQVGVGRGEIKFDSADPTNITKIYVSKTSSGTENPNTFLAQTWQKGQTIEVYGSKPKGQIDYEGQGNYKFEITADTLNVGPAESGYFVLSVKPLKTSALTGVFSPGSYVFISPSDVLAKKYANANIAKGSLDSEFAAYAEIIRDYGKPVILRYAYEMNGDWFPWSAGNRQTKLKGDENGVAGYGRRRYFDTGNTEGNFVASWKHIYDVMKPITSNVKFFWCIIGGKEIGGYFPGDKYVDYVGFDVYSGINDEPHGDLAYKVNVFANNVRKVSKKPMLIGEIGINVDPQNKSNFSNYRKDWLINGYEDIYVNHPYIDGIIYFNIDMRKLGEPRNNWLIWDKPEIASAYKSLLLKPKFQGRFGSSPAISQAKPPVAAVIEPYGYHDSASCTNITGWACDETDYSRAVAVKFYADGPSSEGIYLGTTQANLPREEAVGRECGGVSSKGFSFSIPSIVKDGNSHKIYAYAVDDDTSSVKLTSSPKVIQCSGGQPSISPPPSDPKTCVRKVPTVIYANTSQEGKRKQEVTYKIRIKNNDIGCTARKVDLDLVMPTIRWSYSPERITLNPNEVKIVDLKVKSGPYSAYGKKNLTLTILGAYKPFTVFDTRILEYTVVK